MPWVAALAILSFREGGRWNFMLIAALGMQFFAGEPTIEILTLLIVAGGWIVAAFHSSNIKGSVIQGVRIAFITALIISVQLIPTLLWLPHTIRGQGLDYRMSAAFWSFHPARLVELIIPGFYGSVMSSFAADFWGGAYSDAGYPYIFKTYVGWIPFLVAPLAWKNKAGKTALIISACGLLLSFGHHLPFYSILQKIFIPLWFVRYPEKFLILFTFGLAVATSTSFNELMQSRSIRAAIVSGILFLAATMFCMFFPWPDSISETQKSFQFNQSVTAVSYGLISVVVISMLSLKRFRSFALFVLPILLVLNIAAFTMDILVTVPRAQVHTVSPLLTQLNRLTQAPILHLAEQQQTKIFSGTEDPQIRMQRILYPLTGMPAGVQYGATSDIDRMGWSDSTLRESMIRKSFPKQQALHLLRQSGIKTVLSLERLDHFEGLEYNEATDGIYFYSVRDSDSGVVRFERGIETIKIEENRPHRIKAKVIASSSARITILRNAVPGWSCEMNGQQVSVVKGEAGFISLDIAEGENRIELRYLPPGFLAGLLLSAAGLVLLFFFWSRETREEQR
jgi:hypothetical protein